MKVNAIKCKKCGDIIFSRSVYDCHPCSCDDIFIDGGFDYLRIGWKGKNPPKSFEIEINATKEELYSDWANRKNKFGVITEEK